jgi:hypothetical protein
MDWIRKAANERDMERHRQEAIEVEAVGRPAHQAKARKAAK